MIREFASESRFTGVYLVDLDAEYNEYYKTGKLGDKDTKYWLAFNIFRIFV